MATEEWRPYCPHCAAIWLRGDGMYACGYSIGGVRTRRCLVGEIVKLRRALDGSEEHPALMKARKKLKAYEEQQARRLQDLRE